MKTSVTKKFKWEAAHQIPNHKGKCGRLHGHSYVAEITVEGEVNQDDIASDYGMVVDFYELSDWWKPVEENILDHHNLNETLDTDYHPTTAENIARFLFDYFRTAFNVVEVSVWETATGKATVKV